MLLLSMVYLQTVISFTVISPPPRINNMPRISQRENNILQPKYKNGILKGQRQEKSTALSVGAFGGGGMMKKSSGSSCGGGGTSSFG